MSQVQDILFAVRRVVESETQAEREREGNKKKNHIGLYSVTHSMVQDCELQVREKAESAARAVLQNDLASSILSTQYNKD